MPNVVDTQILIGLEYLKINKMKHYLKIKQFAFIILTSCLSIVFAQNNKTTSVYLIGDSTVADYTGDYEPGKDYMKSRYPVAGWGQEFQPFFYR